MWDRWRRLNERERRGRIQAEKGHLDTLLEQTLQIEAEQMNTTDVAALGAFLDNVTRIKLRALRELSQDELRGDRAFSIFLTQCANLISKIQLKIVAHESKHDPATQRDPRRREAALE